MGKKKVQKLSGDRPVQLYFDRKEEVFIEVEEVKEKATFNLPVKLLEELEDKWVEIRKLSGSKQVSKTLIVEEALRMAFAEFDLQKHIGKFYGRVTGNKAIKQRMVSKTSKTE